MSDRPTPLRSTQPPDEAPRFRHRDNTSSWKVSYRRADWAGVQSRIFTRRHDAVAFMAKLTAGGRPELAPLILCRLDRRPVGKYELDPDQPAGAVL